MKIKIVRSDGTKCSAPRIIGLRMIVNGLFGGVIPIFGAIYSITDILFIFGDRQKCIHDHLADTIVVNTESL